MATKPMKRPIVRDAANKQFTELPDGQFVDVSAIPLDGADSSGAPNLLKHAPDGLAVYARDCIFSEEGNALEVRGGKMYVPDMSAKADGLISKDDGNKLKLGSDNGLFVSQTVVSVDADNLVTVGSDGGAKLTPNDVLSNGDVNLLTIDPVDKKIILTKEAIQGNLPVVSQDDGNLVHHGSDKGVYLSLGDILREGDVILHDDGGKVAADISMVYNQPTGVLQLIGYDGVTEVARVIIPSSTSVLKGVELTNGKPDVAGGETIEGDYHLTLMFRDQHGAWSDAVGVQVTTTKGSAGTAEYTTKLADGGVAVSAVRAVFNGSSAIAEGGSSPATVMFGDTATVYVAFSVSGSVVSGTVRFTPQVGLKSGVYLHFIWALSDGSVVDTYVDVTDLIDVYTAGRGIAIDGNTISVDNTVLRTNVQQVITAVKTFDTGYFGKAVAVGSTVISPTNGAVFTKTITTDTTFSISAIPSGAVSCFTLVLTNGGSHTVGWPGSVRWTEGTPPELIASGVDVITFITPNGGTTWYGCHSVQGVPAE